MVLAVVPGVVVAAAVEVRLGAVTAGIETGGVVVSPELSLPHPAAINPMAAAIEMTTRERRITTRLGRAGGVRSTGSH